MLIPRLRVAAARYATVSWRSLALWRLLLGLTCAQAVLRRWSMLKIFYSDAGAYPASALDLQASWQAGPLGWVSNQLALNLVFAACFLVALAFAAGLWMRVVRWLLLPSLFTLDARIAPLCTGGEVVLRLQALYSLFFAVERVWSLDAWLKARRGSTAGDLEPPTTAVQSWAYPLILLQLAVIYFFSGLAKSGESWQDGTAVARALGSATLVTNLGAWVARLPQPLLHAMTKGTLLIELSLPALLLTPWFRRQAHLLAIALMVALHAGIWLTMDVGSFSLAMVSHLPLLWHPRGLESRVQIPTPKQRRWQVLAVASLTYLMAARLGQDLILWEDRVALPLPQAINRVSSTLGLLQCWMMFSPDPPFRDFIVVTDAVTRKGRHFDPWREIASGRAELLSELPVSVVRQHTYTRYENYMALGANSAIHPYFARWVLSQSPGGDPVERFDAWLMVISTASEDIVPASDLERRAGVMTLPLRGALPIVGFEARGVWAPERAFDGKVVPEGTHVYTPVSATMSAGCPTLTLDLGQPHPVRSVFVQSDAIDHYFIQGSLDGKVFGALGESPTILGRQHINRIVTLTGEPVRFVRLRPEISRGFRHFLSEVALFDQAVSLPPTNPTPNEHFITSLERPTVVGIVSGTNHPSPDCPAEDPAWLARHRSK